jgi:hypothetical protein
MNKANKTEKETNLTIWLAEQLLNDPVLRQEFETDSAATLTKLGLNNEVLAKNGLDLATLLERGISPSELESRLLETRRAKSAWWGGNPFKFS